MPSGRPTNPDVEPKLTILPPSLLLHLRGDIFRHQIGPFQTYRDNLIELIFRAIENIGVVRQRGVVHENIDTAKLRHDSMDHLCDVAGFRDVAQHHHGLSASLGDFIDHCCPRPSCISTTAIFAPSEAKSFAIALPIFLPAPVMTAT
jgi:hypothetical protein